MLFLIASEMIFMASSLVILPLVLLNALKKSISTIPIVRPPFCVHCGNAFSKSSSIIYLFPKPVNLSVLAADITFLFSNSFS